MIIKYENKNAFNAGENLLLVPVPVKATSDFQGFAGQVVDRFPIASLRLRNLRGLNPGQLEIVGSLGGEYRWMAKYSLALCGIHYREAEGWRQTPELLGQALDSIVAATELGGAATIATAGIPGTGFSGLRGNADPSRIKSVLESHPLAITVYQDDVAGDRARMLAETPPLQGEELVGA